MNYAMLKATQATAKYQRLKQSTRDTLDHILSNLHVPANGELPCWYGTQRGIAKARGCSTRTVVRHLKILQKEGWLELKSEVPGVVNEYSVFGVVGGATIGPGDS